MLVEVAAGDVLDGDALVVGDAPAVVADTTEVLVGGETAFDAPVHPTRSAIAQSTRRIARRYALPERVGYGSCAVLEVENRHRVLPEQLKGPTPPHRVEEVRVAEVLEDDRICSFVAIAGCPELAISSRFAIAFCAVRSVQATPQIAGSRVQLCRVQGRRSVRVGIVGVVGFGTSADPRTSSRSEVEP